MRSEASARLWGANVITVVVPPQMADRVPFICLSLQGELGSVRMGWDTCFISICASAFTEKGWLFEMDVCVDASRL